MDALITIVYIITKKNEGYHMTKIWKQRNKREMEKFISDEDKEFLKRLPFLEIVKEKE